MTYWKNIELNSIEYKIDNIVHIEKWVDVKDYEGHYMISDLGRVKALKRAVKHSRCDYITMPERILSQKRRKGDGYLDVNLAKDGVHTSTSVHRLVSKHFIDNPLNLPEVNHKWGIADDNRVTELEWVSASENQLHSYRVLNRRAVDVKGSKNPRFLMFLNTQTGIFYTYHELANYFNVVVETMRCIVSSKDERLFNFIKT